MKFLSGSLLFTVALLANVGHTHDFWIRPSSFEPGVGERVETSIWIGHAGEPESYARNPNHLVEFVWVGREQRLPLLGRPGAVPAGFLEVPAEGPFALLYRSHSTLLEMPAEKFEAYLAEEGLDHVIEARKSLGASERPGRERYSRAAKALGRTSGSTGAWFDEPVGLDLELRLRGDLETTLRFESPETKTAPLVFEATWNGEPVAGLQIRLECLDSASPDELLGGTLQGRTDAEGLVRLTVPRHGAWKATTVHMQRAAAESDHDWSSVFGSLVFPMSPAEPAPASEDFPARPEVQGSGGCARFDSVGAGKRNSG